jgi:hypothetical protein
MKHCPNCGNEIGIDRYACGCGELLRGQVTHVGGWETETVFRPAARSNGKGIAVLAVVLAAVIFGLGLATPKMLDSIRAYDQTGSDQPQPMASQNPTSSDLVPNDDLTIPDSPFAVKSETSEAVTAKRRDVRRQTTVENDTATAADGQLVNPSSDTTGIKTSTENVPDCKPTVTADLKRPEPAAPADEKLPVKSAVNYLLGPRGGCFFVTSGGSKKYVDRSLCSQTTAAARQ